MLGRSAIVVIPTLAVGISAMVLLGPGAARPAVGVRLRGASLEGRAVSYRLEVVRRYMTVEEPIPLDGLRIDAVAGGAQIGTWTGNTGPDGVAEVEIESPVRLSGRLDLLITQKGRALLGQASIPLLPPSPLGPKVGVIAGSPQADKPLALRVEALRGILAAPFPEVLRIRVTDESGAHERPGAALTITALGADLFEAADAKGTPASPITRVTDAIGQARVTVRPLAHQVDVSITAKLGDETGQWEGTLPVVPGAIWLDPEQGPSLTLVSPSPRERAYLSFFTESGRVGGAMVPLSRDAQGFYRGQVAAPSAPGAKVLYATIAGDAREQGAGTAAWPIAPREGVVLPGPFAMVFDGLPHAEAREQQRSWEARRAGMFVVGAAALLEILLLVRSTRSAQKGLETHIVNASSGGMSEEDRDRVLKSARDYPVLRVLVAAAVLTLLFAIVAALATFR